MSSRADLAVTPAGARPLTIEGDAEFAAWQAEVAWEIWTAGSVDGRPVGGQDSSALGRLSAASPSAP